jgi:hypothetical protein
MLAMPSGPRRGDRMASTLTFKLVTVDGAPADLAPRPDAA